MTQKAQQYGIDPDYLIRTAMVESHGDPNAKNPNSSAGGLFQFIDGTARQYGLKNKFDPVASTDAAARLTADNARILRNGLGREPTHAELYLAHQQGATGALNLLKNPNRPASTLVGVNAVIDNGGTQNQTAGDFVNRWGQRFNGNNQAQPSQPQTDTQPQPNVIDDFRNGYPLRGLMSGLNAVGAALPEDNNPIALMPMNAPQSPTNDGLAVLMQLLNNGRA